MARIRSIKPELRTSLTVAAWPREVRYAWVLLWGYLDDHGRGRDDLRLLVADLFPLDRDVTEKKMGRWLDLWSGGDDPVLCRYAAAGQPYLHAIKWTNHQRVSHPSPSRFPPCPIHESLVNHSGNPPSGFGTSCAPAEQGAGSREQGKEELGSRERGACEQGGDDTHATAEDLVTDHVPGIPRPVRAKLINETATLLGDGFGPVTAAAALESWKSRPGSAPGLLPFLAGDLILDDRLPKKPALAVGVDAPSWCGRCDEHSRWEDTGSGWRRCPRCHPANLVAQAVGA